MVET
jgi:hypothetical protein